MATDNDAAGSAWSWLPARIANVTLLVAGVVNTGLGVLNAFQGRVDLATLCLTAGLILLFAATIDRFEFIKGWGIEAKTKALDRTLTESKETLTRVRQLAEMTAGVLVDLQARAGRMPTTSPDLAYKTSRDVYKVLTALGSSDALIRKCLEPWAATLAVDLSESLRSVATKQLNDLSIEFKNERTALVGLDDSDPAVRTALERMNRLAEFVRNMWDSSNLEGDGPMAHGRWMRRLVQDAAAIDDRAGRIVANIFNPWIQRLEHLHLESDISDPTQWFDAIRRPR